MGGRDVCVCERGTYKGKKGDRTLLCTGYMVM